MPVFISSPGAVQVSVSEDDVGLPAAKSVMADGDEVSLFLTKVTVTDLFPFMAMDCGLVPPVRSPLQLR
jgi:hypothetical protein